MADDLTGKHLRPKGGNFYKNVGGVLTCPYCNTVPTIVQIKAKPNHCPLCTRLLLEPTKEEVQKHIEMLEKKV